MEVHAQIDQVEFRRVSERLDRLVRDTDDLTPAMRAVSEYLLYRAETSFENESAPDGAPWAPLSPATIRERRRSGKDGPILQRDRRLFNSLDTDHGRDFAATGTNLVYASTQQFGRRSDGVEVIPARPFLGVARRDGDEITDIVARYLER
ncbi:MAG: phage virion morphogenesis protein [Holophagales bacterium]|nr:phage virion morphogenesis protein [Holophagales bacterium]MYC11927.1 phage virion morphogenesis protein [Holophagales bacterium]